MCIECEECIYLGEGDYFCGKYEKIIREEVVRDERNCQRDVYEEFRNQQEELRIGNKDD